MSSPDVITITDDPLWRDCERFVSGHQPRPVDATLRALTESPYAALPPDLYGRGGALAVLEERMVELLGTQAAVFVPKGTTAQQSVLRAYADRAGTEQVVVHPLSHIDLDEDSAYERLHGLVPVRLGQLQPFTAEQLAGVRGRVAAVTVELPLRRAAYRLTPFDELTTIAEWCRDHDVPLHLDGARLWEAAAAYERPLSDLAGLAATTYVSFYKGLGGLGGCVIAGPRDVVDEAKAWADRHGANLFAAWPFVLSALEGLDRHLDLMPAYRERAVALAKSLGSLDGAAIAPDPPDVNAFQVHLDAEPQQVAERALDVARETSTWVTGRVRAGERPGSSVVEVVVGDAVDRLSDDEVVAAFGRLVEQRP